ATSQQDVLYDKIPVIQGTPTPTPTGTLPTSTPTRTSTLTPIPTATPCGATGNYTIATGTATIVAGTVNIGSACDDCVTDVVLPFPFQLYNQSFTGVGLDSNGRALFPTGPSNFVNSCLPATGDTYTIYPYWTDLRTDGAGDGIFTSVSGAAPNRIFNIEWRTSYFSGGGNANFTLRLYEGQPGGNSRFDVIYGVVTQGNASATGGVQRNATAGNNTQDFCNGAGGASTGLKSYTLPLSCGSVTPATSTATRTSTTIPTSTRTLTATAGPPTNTATLVPPTLTPTITPTVGCAPLNRQVNIESFAFQPQNITVSVGSIVQWTNLDQAAHDVHSAGNWTSPLLNQGESFSFTFNSAGTYSYICQPHPFMTGTITVIGGCTPTVTNTPVPPTSTNTVVPTATSCPLQFSDVPATNTFYPFVRCLVCRGIISGYSDGTFRPNNQVTRGQLSKMVSNSAGYNESITGQTFTDVPPSNTFYVWIERLTRRGHMTGYVCGGPGEPCVNNRPYFRPFANATRGQISKIVSNAAGYSENYTSQTFQDVPASNEFYQFIERLAARGIIGGYPCGGPGEPCVNNRPYFRPFNDATRGQVSKIVASAFYPNCQTP
ncbi:MAG: S-layer homology domain-containing protein, partial [Chloroflexia bacterium]